MSNIPGDEAPFQNRVLNSQPWPQGFWDDPPTTLEPGNANPWNWDTCVILGVSTPGVCLVQGGKHRRIDVKKVKGKTDPTFTFLGGDANEIILTIKIWTKPQLQRLYDLVRVLKPHLTSPDAVTKQTVSPVSVWHPSLFLLDISSVLIKSFGLLEPSTPKGVWAMRIHCYEFNQPADGDVTSTAVATRADLTDISHAITASPANLTPPSKTDAANPNST